MPFDQMVLAEIGHSKSKLGHRAQMGCAKAAIASRLESVNHELSLGSGATIATNFDAATDIASAGAALAGLVLVYIGGVATAYGSYRTEDQPAVRNLHLRRAWFGFAGFAFSLTASALAILAKWLGVLCLETTGGIFLFVAFAMVAATALWTVLDI
jgi:hypothetical protein